MPKGLTVICAENGGGKTTLRDFLRAGFFGFTRDDKNRYAVDAPLAHGGTINFAVRAGESYQLAFDGRKNKSAVKSLVGQPSPELGILLGSASPQLYRNVFAIGLHELQDARNLDDEKVQTMIGAFGSGQSGQVFQKVRNDLFKEIEERFRPGGSKPAANKLMAELKTLQDELKRLKAEADSYWENEQRSLALHQEIEQARIAQKEAQSRHEHIQVLAQSWPHFVALSNVKRQLAEMEIVVENFPQDGIAKLGHLNEGLKSQREDLQTRSAALEKGRRELAALVIPEHVLEASHEIDDFHGRFALYEQNSERLRKTGEELKQAGHKQRDELAKLGPGWTPEKIAAFEDDVASQGERAEASRLLADAERALSAAKIACEQLAQEVAVKKTRAEEARAVFVAQWPHIPAAQSELDARLLALTGIRAKLAEIGRLGDKKEQFERELSAANEEVAALQQRLAAPVVTAPVDLRSPLQLLRAIGAIAVIAGLVMAASLYKLSPIAALVAPLAGVAIFVFCWRYQFAPTVTPAASGHDVYFESQLKSWQAKQAAAQQALVSSESQIAQANSQLQTQCQVFGRQLFETDCDDLQAKLSKASEMRRAWEQAEQQVKKLEETAQEREAELSRRKKELGRAEAHLQTVQGRWTNWLRAQGLQDSLSPASATAICDQVVQVRAAMQQLETHQKELSRLKQLTESYETDAAALFSKIERPVPVSLELGGSLRRLRDERDAARLQSNRHETLSAALPDQETAIAQLNAEIESKVSQRTRLLEAGSAQSEEEFLKRATAWEERQALLAEVRSHLGRLETLSSPGSAVERLQAELSAIDWESLESERAAAETALGQTTEQLRELDRQRGQIDEACRRLATSDDVAVCNDKIEAAKAELNDLAEEWAVRKLAYLLMDKAREKFETERQPAVLQSASVSLGAMTAGRINRIVKPIDGGKYRLHRADGSALDDDQTWNTALKEQTYLSLRFGLIDAYSVNSEPLPIILDDALVNLDPRHLQGAVNCIGELAERHQVIYLTCHPHTMQCFAALEKKPSFYRIHDRAFHAAEPGDFAVSAVAR